MIAQPALALQGGCSLRADDHSWRQLLASLTDVVPASPRCDASPFLFAPDVNASLLDEHAILFALDAVSAPTIATPVDTNHTASAPLSTLQSSSTLQQQDHSILGNYDASSTDSIVQETSLCDVINAVDAANQPPQTLFEAAQHVTQDTVESELSSCATLPPFVDHDPITQPIKTSSKSLDIPARQSSITPGVSNPITKQQKAEIRKIKNRESSARSYYNRKSKIQGLEQELRQNKKTITALFSKQLELREQNARYRQLLWDTKGIVFTSRVR